MDFELPADDDPRRAEVRDWLADHPRPSGRQLAEAGLVAPHWPAPWGLDADPIHQLVIDEELRRAGVRRPVNPIGIGWAGPTLLHAGTDEQQERYLLPLLAGEEIWCQLFSEPGSGSDLASLSTRAVRDGDEWVVNGQKIWTSLGHAGQVRHPHRPDRPRRRQAARASPTSSARWTRPASTIRPIVEMTGVHIVQRGVLRRRAAPGRQPGRRAEGQGWALAKVTLANERVSLSSGGALWGHGPGGRRPARPGPRSAAGSTIPCCASGSASCSSRPRCSG